MSKASFSKFDPGLVLALSYNTEIDTNQMTRPDRAYQRDRSSFETLAWHSGMV